MKCITLPFKYPGSRNPPRGEVWRLRNRLIGFLSWITDTLTLVKPGIVLLVGVTTFSGSVLAAPHLPFSTLLVPTLITLLAAAGAAVWNQILDRDLDLLMERTRHRPLPSRRYPLASALLLALTLTLSSLALSLWKGGARVALLTLTAIAFYAGIYTYLLKRRTPLCTEIGGVSGSLPPLIGWFYFREDLTPLALFLPFLLFFWQPPHFWILGILAQKEYLQARIPVFPVTHGVTFTQWRTLGYTLIFLLLSIFPLLIGETGWLYGSITLILGFFHLLLALNFTFFTLTPSRTLRFFLFSLFHLFAISLALAGEKLLYST